MRIAVVGAGAIGAYVGAALARGGADVHLVARGAHLEALREHGVRVLSPRGDFTAHPPATDDPGEIGEVDVVFLGLKAHTYAGAGPLLEPLLEPSAPRSSRRRTASRGGTSTASRASTTGGASRASTRTAPCPR